MEKNRKYDTLTKNALIDDILNQVRNKKSATQTPAAQPSMPSNPNFFDKVQQVQDKKEALPKERQMAAATLAKNAPPQTAKVLSPPAPPKDRDKDNLLGETILLNKVSPKAKPASASEIAKFFSGEETPESFMPPEELQLEKAKKKRKFSLKKIKSEPLNEDVAQPQQTKPAPTVDSGAPRALQVDLNITDEVVLEIDHKKAQDVASFVQSPPPPHITQELDELTKQAKALDSRQLLEQNRAQAVKKFAFDDPTHGEINQASSPLQEPDQDQNNADEPEELSQIERLFSLRGKLRLRMGITGVLGIVLLYHNLALTSYKLPLPAFLQPALNPFGYLLCNLLILICGVFVCTSTLINGAVYGLTLRGDNDSPVAFAYWASVIQGLALLFAPHAINNIQMSLFGGLALISLWFNCLGKLNIVQRTLRNWRFLTAGNQKFACRQLEDEELIAAIGADLAFSNPVIAYRAKSPKQDRFFDDSFEEDLSDKFSKYMAPICLLIAAVAGLYVGIKSTDALSGIYVLAMITAVASPLSLMLSFNLPFTAACRKMNRFGGVIGSYRALKSVNKITTLSVSDTDLFPAGTVQMHGIKTFANERIDEALVECASVLCTQDCAIGQVFLKVIEGNTGLLTPVENQIFENGLGYACWLSNKRVLVGNRKMMEAHSIQLPSHDYEQKYRKDGQRDLIYLAGGGELLAMFVISYTPNAKVQKLLQKLTKAGVSLAVCTGDPCITPQVLEQVYGLTSANATILHNQIGGKISKLSQQENNEVADLLCMDHLVSFVNNVLFCVAVKTKVLYSLLVQSTGVLLGVFMALYFIVFATAGGFSLGAVVLYQLVWCALVLAFNTLKK